MKFFVKIFLIGFILVSNNLESNAQSITWQKTYGYGNLEYGYSIVQTEDEGYIAVGRSFAMRLNKFGDTLWRRTYGFTCLQIEKCPDSNFIISSLSGDETSLFKIDLDGNILWRKYNVGSVFKISNDSFIYVLRDINNVRKYNLNGDSIWNKNLGTSITLKAIFVQNNDEIVLLAGINDSTINSQSILKINSKGDLTDTINFTATFNPRYLVCNLDNSFVVAGIILYKVRLSKYDNNGSLLWAGVYDSISPDYADCNYLIKTNDEGYAIAGTYDTGNFNFLMRLIKTDSSGTEQFRKLYGFNDNDQAFCLRQTTDSGFVLIGIRDNFDLGDIYIVKTDKFGYASPPVSINDLSENISENYTLFQNYPNPFNPVTKINYQLNVANYVILTVYDILGNEVKTLVNQKQNAGSYEIEFDGSDFPSGIYFYKLVANDFTAVKRMVLVK